jgi:hypothetical protein
VLRCVAPRGGDEIVVDARARIETLHVWHVRGALFVHAWPRVCLEVQLCDATSNVECL